MPVKSPIGTAIAVASADDDDRAEDAVSDAAARHADRVRKLREKGPVDRTDALHDDVTENHQQRAGRKRRAAQRERDAERTVDARRSPKSAIPQTPQPSRRSAYAPNHQPRERVDDDANDEEDQAEFDQRADVNAGRRFGELVGDHARKRI